ncbi:MAG: trigger factor [Candidatus Dormibacteria bacterium]
MEVSVERRPGSVVELAIEVPADQVEKAIDRAFNRLAPRVRVPGFRPGKAPRTVIEREIGWPALRDQALEILVPETVTEVVRERDLQVIDTPQVEVEQFERIGGARIKALVTVKPEVELGDYRSIRAPLETPEVTDAQVDASIDEIRGELARLVPAEGRPAQEGDRLVVDLEVVKDGELLPDGTSADLELDMNPQALLPGLFDGVVGINQGETRAVTVTLPQDYRRQELAGQEATFKVTVKEIKEKQLPAIDDDLARESGAGDTVAELRQKIEERLRVAVERDAVFAQQKAAVEQLVAQSTFEVPEVLIHEEIDRELRNLALSLEQQGVDFDKFVQAGGLDLQKFHDERHEHAADRVRQELVLDAMATREGIEPSPEHVLAEARRGLEGAEDTERLVASDRVQAYVRERLRLQWALLWLSATARGEAWEPPAPEAMSPQQVAASEMLETPQALINSSGGPLVAEAPEAPVEEPGGMTEL